MIDRFLSEDAADLARRLRQYRAVKQAAVWLAERPVSWFGPAHVKPRPAAPEDEQLRLGS